MRSLPPRKQRRPENAGWSYRAAGKHLGGSGGNENAFALMKQSRPIPIYVLPVEWRAHWRISFSFSPVTGIGVLEVWERASTSQVASTGLRAELSCVTIVSLARSETVPTSISFKPPDGRGHSYTFRGMVSCRWFDRYQTAFCRTGGHQSTMRQGPDATHIGRVRRSRRQSHSRSLQRTLPRVFASFAPSGARDPP